MLGLWTSVSNFKLLLSAIFSIKINIFSTSKEENFKKNFFKAYYFKGILKGGASPLCGELRRMVQALEVSDTECNRKDRSKANWVLSM